MKHYLLLIFFFIIAGCVGGAPVKLQTVPIPAYNNQAYNQANNNQAYNQANSSNQQSTAQAPTYVQPKQQEERPERNSSSRNDNDDCENDRGCERQCDNIFDNSRSQKECYELSQGDVNDMEYSYELLEKPDDDGLDDIEIDDLKAIHDIDDDVLEELIEDHSKREAGDFLVWLFSDNNEEAYEFFIEDENEDNDLLEIMLKNLNNDVVKAFAENVDRSDSLIEYLLDEAEDDTIEEIVHEFFTDGSSDGTNKECDDEDEENCIFQKYCRLDLGPQERKDLYNIDYFSDFMEDVLEETDNDKIEDTKDYNVFCKNPKYQVGATSNGNNGSGGVASNITCSNSSDDHGIIGNNVVYFNKINAISSTINFSGLGNITSGHKYCNSLSCVNKTTKADASSVSLIDGKRIKYLSSLQVKGSGTTINTMTLKFTNKRQASKIQSIYLVTKTSVRIKRIAKTDSSAFRWLGRIQEIELKNLRLKKDTNFGLVVLIRQNSGTCNYVNPKL